VTISIFCGIAVLLSALLVSCGGGGAPTAQEAASYILAGAVSAPEGSAVDGDVNDPLAPFLPNDDASSAQEIPNPVILGGYVTAAATGISGDRFEAAADPVDRYRASLADGQTITLYIGDPDAADLDLFLYEAGKDVVVDRSETAGSATETRFSLQYNTKHGISGASGAVISYRGWAIASTWDSNNLQRLLEPAGPAT